jgi:predicted enzyme related to lactoylglutathione lyase
LGVWETSKDSEATVAQARLFCGIEKEEITMINNITIGDISIDCTDPERTRNFYASLTGWEKRVTYGPALVCDNGLILLFMGCDFDYIPPVWPEEPGKQQKQMHFNFGVDDLPSAVEEAIRLGATRAAVQYDGERYVTMFDPEGHPFCYARGDGAYEHQL